MNSKQKEKQTHWKKTVLTSEEWYESKNIESFCGKIPVYINRPPKSCPIDINHNTKNYIIYSN